MNSFTTLSPKNRKIYLETLYFEHKTLLQKEKKLNFAKRPPCPFCKQIHIYKVGINHSGLTRYKCSTCKKSYTTRSGTPEHWLHLRSKFEKYMHSMLTDGHRSLKSMAVEFDIAVVTAFDWRHKILASINCTPSQFTGLVEFRNSILPFSRKGIGKSKATQTKATENRNPVQIIITADSQSNASIHVARIGQLKASDIDARLRNRISSDAIVVSRINKTVVGQNNNGLPIKQFSKKNKLSITLFSSIDNPFDLDDSEARMFHSNLKNLIFNKSRGVATKYLQHYAEWTVLLQLKKDILQKKSAIYQNHQAWTSYTALENYFRLFMSEFSNTEYIKTSHRIWKTAEIQTLTL